MQPLVNKANAAGSTRACHATGSAVGYPLAMPFRVAVALSSLLLSGCAVPLSHRELYSNGAPRAEGEIVAGRQQGEWNFFFESGRAQARGTYREDRRHGHWTFWHENGAVEMEGEFLDGLRAGYWRYGRPNGKPLMEGYFHEDHEIGEWRYYDEEGRLREAGDRDGSKSVLRWTTYYADGRTKSEGMFFDNVAVGKWSSWDSTGHRSEREYALPDDCRIVRESWPDGKLRRNGVTRNGKPVGRWSSWHPGGTRRMAGDFGDGSRGGVWLAHGFDGKPMASGRLDRGRVSGPWLVRDANGVRSKRFADRPAPVWSGNWSTERDLSGRPLISLVETWLGEIRSPARAPARLVRRVEAGTPRSRPVPGKPSPTVHPPNFWTVRDRANYKRFVDALSRVRPKGTGGSYSRRVGKGSPLRATGSRLVGSRPPGRGAARCGRGKLKLGEVRGKRIVLVVLHGFGGEVCPYCCAQTEVLHDQFEKFRERDTEVFVVFPGDRGRLDRFLETYARTVEQEGNPNYTAFFDPDLKLVDSLRVRWQKKNLAQPTAMVIDRSGVVRYAFVGEKLEDRPTIASLVSAIDDLEEQ